MYISIKREQRSRLVKQAEKKFQLEIVENLVQIWPWQVQSL